MPESVTVETIAVVFPGQGSQRPGMAHDFCARFAEARAVFEAASDALGFDVAALCRGDDERIDLTEYAQPAILTAEIAMLRALTGPSGLAPSWYGGHSLGEYTALVAAGVIDLSHAVRLVHCRGRLMQEAVPVGTGGMTAVIAPAIDVEMLRGCLGGLTVDVANVNSPNQVVLSGATEDLRVATDRIHAVEKLEHARCIPLRVSAPFHCRLMRPAEHRLRPLLVADSSEWQARSAERVAANFTGGIHVPERQAIVDTLTRQVTAPVRWLDNMHVLLERSERIVEIGPSKPLSGFFNAIGHRIETVTDTASAEVVAGRR